MQSNRTDGPEGHALPVPGERVVGLGAPVSVVIRPDACELALLRAEVSARLAAHAAERPSTEAMTPARHEAVEQWEAEHSTLEAMLESLGTDQAPGRELLWPAAYAAPVLHGAVAAAALALAHAPADAAARQAVASLTETLHAFLAVDSGGLQDVQL